jgi:hypothetical protein
MLELWIPIKDQKQLMVAGHMARNCPEKKVAKKIG